MARAEGDGGCDGLGGNGYGFKQIEAGNDQGDAAIHVGLQDCSTQDQAGLFSGCGCPSRREPWHTGVVNRRLRLALLLAVLAAAGPSVSAPQAFDASRTGVSIAWFRVTPAGRLQIEVKQAGLVEAGLKTRLYSAQVAFSPQPDPLLPDTLRVHSLFQRPPPLHS